MKFLVILFSFSISLIASEKPNIVFIFADDMSIDATGLHGIYNCKTPNLDKLAKSGVSFTRAYNMGAWSGAVCAASRAMLNSGTFVNHAKVAIKKKPHWSEYMKQAGYETYMTGKWHVPGAPRFDVVKDERGGMPNGSGYNRPKSLDDYKNGWKPWDKSRGGFWEGGTHWSEVVANNSIDFIERAKNVNKPFFMYIAFNATHDPRQAPKEFIDMYPLEDMDVPKNFLANYPYDTEIGCDPKRLRDERLMPTPRTDFAVKVHRQEYFALATHMDQQIGRILKAIELSGKADNTYIIFTADHGLAVGNHGLVGKQSMYEHSMRVPFFIAGPKMKKGSVFETPIYLQDIMPTTLELAGVEKPEYVDFKSLMGLIRGDRKTQYDLIYGKYIDFQRMVLDGDYKLIFYPKINVYRLFNIKKDRLEMNDLIMNPEYKEKTKILKEKLEQLMQEMGDDN
ncbi:choline sulfatase [Lentisphaera araneosa HTCC2155]|uniref:Choline sulfatase n=1 Tax=Lentisphaera araneosa HTCC2155 TaxID=313628 RepID=A6DQC1_9BACT|nr:sulfatase-like hydrolase/transferase [Lentisphaera araneosa]EDM26172.1 choline sulfatase [Lentisphaera araneosa HTCC2155]